MYGITGGVGFSGVPGVSFPPGVSGYSGFLGFVGSSGSFGYGTGVISVPVGGVTPSGIFGTHEPIFLYTTVTSYDSVSGETDLFSTEATLARYPFNTGVLTFDNSFVSVSQAPIFVKPVAKLVVVSLENSTLSTFVLIFSVLSSVLTSFPS